MNYSMIKLQVPCQPYCTFNCGKGRSAPCWRHVGRWILQRSHLALVFTNDATHIRPTCTRVVPYNFLCSLVLEKRVNIKSQIYMSAFKSSLHTYFQRTLRCVLWQRMVCIAQFEFHTSIFIFIYKHLCHNRRKLNFIFLALLYYFKKNFKFLEITFNKY